MNIKKCHREHPYCTKVRIAKYHAIDPNYGRAGDQSIFRTKEEVEIYCAKRNLDWEIIYAPMSLFDFVVLY